MPSGQASGCQDPQACGMGARGYFPKRLRTLPATSPKGKKRAFLGASLSPLPETHSPVHLLDADTRSHNFVLGCWGPSFVPQLCRHSLWPQRTRHGRLDPQRARGSLLGPRSPLSQGAHLSGLRGRGGSWEGAQQPPGGSDLCPRLSIHPSVHPELRLPAASQPLHPSGQERSDPDQPGHSLHSPSLPPARETAGASGPRRIYIKTLNLPFLLGVLPSSQEICASGYK